MKQIIMLIFITFTITNTFAYEFKLNKKDLAYIDNSPKKKFIINRLGKYQSLKEKVIDYTLIRKLSHVNSFLNRTFSKHDIDSNSSLDHWATPKEFLLQGHLDCEDYAISKYFTLLEINIPKFAFTEIDSYKFTKERFTKKVKVNWGKEDKWNKLLTRVYKLKE